LCRVAQHFFKTSIASVTSTKANIIILHQIVGLALSECDEEKFVDIKGLSKDVIRGKFVGTKELSEDVIRGKCVDTK
jgi:hypothetical protein